MFITVSKSSLGYVFAVGDDPSDDPRSWVWSDADGPMLPDIPGSFETFGEAHAFASRLADGRPSCVLAKKAMFYATANDVEHATMSAEDQTVLQYGEQAALVGQRVVALRHSEGKDKKDDVAAVKREVEALKQEVERIANIVESQPNKDKMAQLLAHLQAYLTFIGRYEAIKKASADQSAKRTMAASTIRAFAEAAMLGLAAKHPDVFVRGAVAIPASGDHEVVLADARGDIVKLTFDRNMLLCDVAPQGQLSGRGRSSVDFLHGYWEPVVSSVGHFHSRGNGVVAVTSPELPANNRRFCYAGFDANDNSPVRMLVSSASVLGKDTWLVKRAEVVTEPAAAPIPNGAEVVCVNPGLSAYHNRTGTVQESSVKPGRFVEYRVDFRRGLGPVWLEDKDIKQVQIGSPIHA